MIGDLASRDEDKDGSEGARDPPKSGAPGDPTVDPNHEPNRDPYGPYLQYVAPKLTDTNVAWMLPNQAALLHYKVKAGSKTIKQVLTKLVEISPLSTESRSRWRAKVNSEVDEVLTKTTKLKGAPFKSQLDPAILAQIIELLPPPPDRRAKAGELKGTDQSNNVVFHLTDTGNSDRLIHYFGDSLRYATARGGWLAWDGMRWSPDQKFQVIAYAKELGQKIRLEAGLVTDPDLNEKIREWAVVSESSSAIHAAINLARAHPTIPLLPSELDGDPFKFNTLSGTLDLRSGEMVAHRREDHITAVAPVKYDPDATAPTWDSFLERAQPDAEVRAYLQRVMGYSITGDVSEQKFFIHHGSGSNGKSLFTEIVRIVLGDYSKVAPFSTFVEQRGGDKIPNDLAMLAGARYVHAKETREASHLDEQVIKSLTGGDAISARFLRQEFFSYDPTFKIHLVVNHLPSIDGGDYAIGRRVKVIPWHVRFRMPGEPEQAGQFPAELDLKARILAERAGVLNWLLAGAKKWSESGLGSAPEVDAASIDYRNEMDPLGQFLADECAVDPSVQVGASVLYGAYRSWRKSHGVPYPISDRALAQQFKSRGFRLHKGHGARVVVGVSVERCPSQSSTEEAVDSDADLDDFAKES